MFEITKKENSDYILNFNKVEYDETDNISSLNNAWFLLKPEKMERKISKYKINEGDIIKIGRITIRIKEIKLNGNNNDYYLNHHKSGNNISNNSINIINSNNNNTRIINDVIEITKNENYKNNQLQSLRTGTNQTRAPSHKSNKILILKEDKIRIENKDNDVNIIQEDNEIKSEKSNKNDNNNELEIKRKATKNKICRICYMEEDDSKNNPLLDPCTCSGSMKYIHYNCLKHWVNSKCYTKIETINQCCSIYKIKPLECELCKTQFPDVITKNGNIYNISEFKPEFENYLIFESLTLDKNKNKYNYVVSLNENDNMIYVGRDKESHVLFSDISVSRTHCILHIEKNNIYINDNDSTFGTLILMQLNSIKLMENLPLYMQIGRTFFKILPVKQKSCFSCNVSETTNDKYYFNQNEKKIFYYKKIKKLNLDKIKNDEVFQEINENNKEKKININIKKIIIKNKDEVKNDSITDNKNKMINILDNKNINMDKFNGSKNSSTTNKSLRKIKLNDVKTENNKSEKEPKKILNIENQYKSYELKHNKEKEEEKNKDKKSNNSQSIYIDEEN